MTTYGYIENNVIVAPVNMCSRFKDIGGWHLLTDEERAVYDWYPCKILNEAFDPATQNRSESPDLSFDDVTKTIEAVYQVIDKDIETIRKEVTDKIRELRKTKEALGIMVDSESYKTDINSQNRVSTMAATLLVDSTVTNIDFERAAGIWVNLTRDRAIKIAQLISGYVQMCFTCSKNLHDQVQAATDIPSILAIDTELGWPTQIYTTV